MRRPGPSSALAPTRLLAGLLPATLLAGCGTPGPVDPPPDPPIAIERTGPALRGVPGQLLPGSVEVRAQLPDGLPAADILLRFEVISGGGRLSTDTATTDAAGAARFAWRLGDDPGAANTVAVRAVERAGDVLRIDATLLPFPAVDAVVVEGLEGDRSVGALLDGVTSAGPADDFVFTAGRPTVGVGSWQPSPAFEDEAAVFIPRGRMAFVPRAAWTEGADTLRIAAPETLRLPLTVWVVRGPFEEARGRLAGDLLTAEAIFDREGLGVRFDPVQFVNATHVDTASAFLRFNCTHRDTLQRAVGRAEDRLNVYVVESVDDVTSRGQACEIGGNFVALGRQAGSTLLSHEIGHNLSLVHPDFDRTHFDRTNVMHSASDTRAYLTEGQIFRVHLNASSALNALFGVRTGPELRSCFFTIGNVEGDPRCPLTQLRLWPDGAFGVYPVMAAAGRRVGWTGGGGAVRAPSPAEALDLLLPGCATGEDGGAAASAAAARLQGAGAGWAERLRDGPGASLRASVAEAGRRLAWERADRMARGGPDAASWRALVPARALDPSAAAEREVRALESRWTGGAARLLSGLPGAAR